MKNNNGVKKSKKWLVILIISIVFLIAEGVYAGIILWPNYNVSSMMKAIDNKEQTKAVKHANNLSDNSKDKISTIVEDYCASLCKSYSPDADNYEEIKIKFDIMVDLDLSDTVMEYYNSFNGLAISDLIVQYCDALNEEDFETTDKVYQYLQDMMQTIDTESTNDVINEAIDKCFADFMDGNIEYSTFSDVAYLACDLVSNTETIYEYIDRAYAIDLYRCNYEICESKFHEEDYLGVCKEIDDIEIDEADEMFKELYGTLYTDAYEMGKEYYVQKAENLASKDDKSDAKELMAEVKEYYQDDIDFASVEALVTEPWAIAYDELMLAWEETLYKDLESTDNGKAILESGKWEESYKPTKVFLYDIDENETPELFMWIDDGEEVNKCYVYAFDGEKAIFVDYINLVYFAKDSQVITLPWVFASGDNEGYALHVYQANKFVKQSDCECSSTDGIYKIDGEEITVEEYNAFLDEYNAISKMEDATTPESADIADCTDLIMGN